MKKRVEFRPPTLKWLELLTNQENKFFTAVTICRFDNELWIEISRRRMHISCIDHTPTRQSHEYHFGDLRQRLQHVKVIALDVESRKNLIFFRLVFVTASSLHYITGTAAHLFKP